MKKTLILTWYNLVHNVPIKKIISTIIKNQSISDNIEFLELTGPYRRLEWLELDYTNYSKIVLYPKEQTYLTFDFFRLFQVCEDNNIELINGNCYDTLNKFEMNSIWKNNNIPVPPMVEINHKLDRMNVHPAFYPAIISMSIGHGGYGDHTLIFDSDSIEMWMRRTNRNHSVIVTKFIDYKDNDGWFRKGRVIRLQDKFIDVNVLGNKINWHVHHKTKGTILLAPNCNHFRDAVPDFDEQIRTLFELTNIDVGAIDFCEKDGQIIPFEITVPYHISYRHYEYTDESYNEFKDESINNIADYWIDYFKIICNVECDWIKFKQDVINYIHTNKGFTDV